MGEVERHCDPASVEASTARLGLNRARLCPSVVSVEITVGAQPWQKQVSNGLKPLPQSAMTSCAVALLRSVDRSGRAVRPVPRFPWHILDEPEAMGVGAHPLLRRWGGSRRHDRAAAS
ncbi:MAG: hypothetical protein WC184_02155 [Acidimicrobiia bacterium]